MKLKKLLICLAVATISISASAQRTPKEIAISRAKAILIATANADVAKIKSLTTPEFYQEQFPFSDAKVRELLLSASEGDRENMIDQVQNHCDAEAVMNRAGDVITVTLINRINNNEFTVKLFNSDGNGNWLIFAY